MRYYLFCFFLFLSGTARSDQAQDFYASLILPPHSIIQDKALGDWGGEWWKWAFSFKRSNSPISDPTGKFCNLGQEGDVWFLAGSYSTKPIVRECTIPKGKTLFFPIINSVYYSPKGASNTCMSITQSVNARTQKPSSLFFRINDVELSDPYLHREASSDCFDPFSRLSDGNSLSWAYPGASNGYWIAVKPLPAGTHILQFGGNLPKFRQNITYKLHVSPGGDNKNNQTKMSSELVKL